MTSALHAEDPRFDPWYGHLERSWCNGNIIAFQAIAPGSIPGLRITYFRGYSSVAEQSTADRWVAGSNPAVPFYF